MEKVTINKASRLYVIHEPTGYFSTCGFDFCQMKARKIAAELGEPEPKHRKGTLAAYRALRSLEGKVRALNPRPGFRSSCEVTPELVGLEGRRVEVRHRWPSGQTETKRFNVGKSSGWIPCHLALHNRASRGGPAVCLGEIESVRVVA